ncbi:hypothetical protein [Halorubrum halophilum]|uniref:hypothetical protein n=1 Tax=Halorubrum halophilum TaxID=413816 RepID=UPI0006792A08|nr:hypothetical protein [Halorubrum halophilum]
MAQANPNDGGGDGYTLPQSLQRFARSPQGFILGAILSPLLEGLNDAVVQFLDLIVFVFEGSEPGLVGTYGIADIPLFIGTQLVNIGATIGGSASDGTGFLGLVDRLVEAAVGFATVGGPLAPIILAGEVVVVVWLLAFIGRRIILVIADAVPGLAGVLGT